MKTTITPEEVLIQSVDTTTDSNAPSAATSGAAAPGVALAGSLYLPPDTPGVVLFAHGSGSSRLSPRNQYIAQALYEAGLGSLLFDLLTPDEDAVDRQTRKHRFDIDLLCDRLLMATEWIKTNPATEHRRIGYFGASTGGGAALAAAGAGRYDISAVVSRGGRPDLAGDALEKVWTPTLLIVGSLDTEVIILNEQALGRMPCEKQLRLVEGATHLFEEPGALEKVAVHAVDWFNRYLT